jgi:xanthine/uracil permease
MWGPALVVVAVTLAIKFFARGFAAVAAVLIGILAGYVVAFLMGQVNFGNMAKASYFAPPIPFKWGFEFNVAIVIGMCFMAVVSAIETVGDTSQASPRAVQAARRPTRKSKAQHSPTGSAPRWQACSEACPTPLFHRMSA